MKALVCEMCNGTDVVKQNGYFVCQTCGTKYSVEEAKKMMIEGTVDVSGSTVRVDNTASVEKYLANARRAKQKEDWEETEKYYNLVEQNDPTNIEAIFYSAYGKAKNSLIDSDIYKRQAAFKVLINCVSIVDDHFSIEKEENEKVIISQISNDIAQMVSGSFVFNQKTDSWGSVLASDKDCTYRLFQDLLDEFIRTLDNIIAKFPQGDKRTTFYYALAVEKAEYMANVWPSYSTKITAKRLHDAWKNVDANHEIPKAFEKEPVHPGEYVAAGFEAGFIIFIVIGAMFVIGVVIFLVLVLLGKI